MATLIGRLLSEINRFRRDKSANLSMLFGLSAIPMLGLIGAGIDYSTASRIRAELVAAADAAALGVITKASPTYQAAINMTSDGPVPGGQQAALDLFNAQIKNRVGFTVSNVGATVTKANWQVTANVTFTGAVPTTIMNVMGFSSMNIAGGSTAVNGMPAYIDFYLLLDNTPSMGLGATQADIDKLVSLTGCAFACHDLSGAEDFYTVAKNNNVTMRINVVASATAQLMDTAANTQSMPNQFRMAIYTLGAWGGSSPSDLHKAFTNSYPLNLVTSLTSSLSTAKSQAAQIDLMDVAFQNEDSDQGTSFSRALPAINTVIPNPGTGQGPSPPQKVLFLVSDGVSDEPNAGSCSGTQNGNRCLQPINVNLCTTIKNRGIRIAVLYTTYLRVLSNSWYMSNMDPWNNPSNPKVSQNMQACATPGLFFEVSPTQGISDAMNALFVKAVQTARLTQ